MSTIIPLDDLDRRQFERLIAQESVSNDGQKATMDLILELVKERRAAKEAAVRERLITMGSVTEPELRQAVQNSIQAMTIDHSIELEDGRYNLILGKGDGREAQYTIMIPCHVDSAECHEDMLQVTTDGLDPDRKRGRQVWDMGGAILNSIVGAAEFEVPHGMQVYWVFTVDEERHSKGAEELIKRWPEWEYVDLVLSSEIGELTEKLTQEGDRDMRYIMARRGRLKMNVSIESGNQGHGATPNIPSATAAMSDATYILRHVFSENIGYGEPIQKKHPLLKFEEIEVRDMESDKPKGDRPNQKTQFKLSVRHVPPSTLQTALEDQKRIFQEIKDRGEWTTWNIQGNLVQASTTSYETYEMPENNEAVRVAKEAMETVSGTTPKPAGAWSAADECIYHESMLKRQEGGTFEGTRRGVIDIPMIGNHAHGPDEWVSWRDIGRVRAVMRLLIEEEEGFQQFVEQIQE